MKVGDKIRIKSYDQVIDHKSIAEDVWNRYIKLEQVITSIHSTGNCELSNGGSLTWPKEAIIPCSGIHVSRKRHAKLIFNI